MGHHLRFKIIKEYNLHGRVLAPFGAFLVLCLFPSFIPGSLGLQFTTQTYTLLLKALLKVFVAMPQGEMVRQSVTPATPARKRYLMILSASSSPGSRRSIFWTTLNTNNTSYLQDRYQKWMDHRMIWIGKDVKDCIIQTPLPLARHFH